MLCQFTVKNFKSIKDEITLNMQATAISEHENQVLKDNDEEGFLPVAVIYGPNGGGKSNVLEALHTLISKVLKPLCAICSKTDCKYKTYNIPITPFAFSSDGNNAPTEFEVFFRTHIAEYRYILHIQDDLIVYERLDRIKLKTRRRAFLFDRNEQEINLKGDFGRFKISEDLSPSIPLLSYIGITYQKNEVVQDVFSWFETSIDFLNYGNPYSELRTLVKEPENIKKLVLDMIKEMDLDIDDFRIEENNDDRFSVYTKHVVNDYSAEIPLAEESSGTQKLFGLLPFIAYSLVNGTTLVIDELDAKIHPVLLQNIIERYTDLNINKQGAQLIFTSHDLSTMNSALFRRDEIWFVAKGNDQNSQLYSLVEFKTDKGKAVRKDAKYDKQYLEGKYGADPYLRRIIDWEKINA